MLIILMFASPVRTPLCNVPTYSPTPLLAYSEIDKVFEKWYNTPENFSI